MLQQSPHRWQGSSCEFLREIFDRYPRCAFATAFAEEGARRVVVCIMKEKPFNEDTCHLSVTCQSIFT